MTSEPTPTALITGGSAGLGLALTRALVERGWRVVTDARRAHVLQQRYAGEPAVVAVAGDVTDPGHRAALAQAVGPRLELLVHNASTLGPLPMRRLAELDDDDLAATFAVNAGAPLALTRAVLPALRAAGGVVVAISSDAAVEHYGGWGAYGATKAALDHLTLTLAEEEGLTTYAVDPGDMRTQMHADAFPGEDISDRPEPDTVVPHLLELLWQRPPAGRYRAADVATGTALEVSV